MITAPSMLSGWWRIGVIVTVIAGFTILVILSVGSYKNAPPIPKRVVGPSGEIIYSGEDIIAGQQVFLKYGLMENGSIWGHGAYLGPDFSASYLHALAIDVAEFLAQERYQRTVKDLAPLERQAVMAGVPTVLKENRYHAQTGILTFTAPEKVSFQNQIQSWTAHFSEEQRNGGLPPTYLTDPKELRALTAFFSWSAWAAAANRPNKTYSYTSNFPYDPLAGNTLPDAAVLWSALSLITLLGGTASILFFFGKFHYLGWKRGRRNFILVCSREKQPRVRGPRSSILSLCRCFFSPKCWWAGLSLTTVPNRALFMVSICTHSSQRAFFGPGTSSWPFSG